MDQKLCAAGVADDDCTRYAAPVAAKGPIDLPKRAGADKAVGAEYTAEMDDTRQESHCGTWLDEELRLLGSQAEQLMKAVLEWIDSARVAPGSKRKDHRANFERRIECYLANALRARFYRENNRIAYHSGNNAYVLRNKDLPGRWLSAASIRREMRLLDDVRLLKTQPGVWTGNVRSYENGRAAMFCPTPLLEDIIKRSCVHRGSISRPAPSRQRLLLLRDVEDFEGSKPEIPFEWSAEHLTWAELIDRHNRFCEAHDIWFDELEEREERRLVRWQNRKLAERSRQPGCTRPEFFNLHLRRIFNDGTFEHGGRLYGAWYQHVPKRLRRRIEIDEIRTVELDFSGMAVRMLYHQAGIDYLDDPYSLPELEAFAEARGQPRDHYRDSVKTLVQAMLNNDNYGVRAEMAKVETKFPPQFTRTRLRDMILIRHEAIQAHFGSGVGKRLQRLDSDIALDVIGGLMEKGILCLPIHDSFIVVESHKAELLSGMTRSYQERLGYLPIIADN